MKQLRVNLFPKTPANLFPALKHTNFRFFVISQLISLIGTGIQNLALIWLALTITDSPFWVGVICIGQFLPLLFLSFHAGSIVDRFSKTKVFLLVQVFTMSLTVILGITTCLEIINFWELLAIACLLGLANTFDLPARQSLIAELVDSEDLANAVSINSMIFNIARLTGPCIAGLIISYLEIELCFFLNALSFIPLFIVLGFLREPEQDPKRSLSRREMSLGSGIKAGFQYVKQAKSLSIGLILLAGVNFFGLLYMLLPFYMDNIFFAGAGEFGIIFAVNGFGACLDSVIASFYPKKFFPPLILLVLLTVF